MTLRLRLAAWFGLSMLALIGVITFAAHRDLRQLLNEKSIDNAGVPGDSEFHIHVGYSEAEIDGILRRLFGVRLSVSIPFILLSVGVGYLLAMRSMRSIEHINRQISLLRPEFFAEGISAPAKDRELNRLVDHINELLKRAASAYSEVSEFSSRVAHELRTPLTLLRMKVEASAAELPTELSEDLQEEIARLSRLVERTLTIAKAQGGRLHIQINEFDLSMLLQDFCDGYSALAEARGIALDWNVEDGLVLRADVDLVRQILHNLLDNAVRYCSTKVSLRASRGLQSKFAQVVISNDLGSLSSSSKGAGIGLRLVTALSDVMSGLKYSAREDDGKYTANLRFELPDQR